jgi:putative acetyltransferase
MLIRDYERRDASAITQLFYDAVHSVNRQDYSKEQVRAWVPEVPDPEIWHVRMSERCTSVAEDNGQILAFAELEDDGHLDMFYCRSNFVRSGVGSKLYSAIEVPALDLRIARIFAEVSITARPFFERCGFSAVQQQTVLRRGVELTNFQMEKRLNQILDGGE